jgi:hypothetical protein
VIEAYDEGTLRLGIMPDVVRTVTPAELTTESTSAGTVVRVVTAWPREFVVVMSVTTEAVSRAVVRTERVKVLPPDVIIVATWAMTRAPLEEDTAIGLVDPEAMYSVDKVAAEASAEEGTLLEAEAAEPVPEPKPVAPGELAEGELPAEEGEEPPLAVAEDEATLPGALFEEAGVPAAEDTAEEGEAFVIGS